jgi:hypothetical protein
VSAAEQLAPEAITITRFSKLSDPEALPSLTTWPALFAELGRCGPFLEFNHPGWSPAEFDPPHRAKENVTSIRALVLDYDNKTKAGERVAAPIALEGVAEALRGRCAQLHTTRNHTADWPRFRVVLPLTRAVTRDEYARLWKGAAKRWPGLDPAPKDPSRFWFTPGTGNRDEFKALELEGPLLDPDELMVPVAEPVPRAKSVHVAGDVNEARALAYIEKMPPAISGAGGHDALWRVACRLVRGFQLDDETAFRILSTKYNPRCSPPWDEKDLRHKINEAKTKSHSFVPVEDRALVVSEPVAVTGEVVDKSVGPQAQRVNWEKYLTFTDKGIKRDVGNAALIVKNLPGLGGLRLNLMSLRATWCSSPIVDVGLDPPEAGEDLRDDHIVYVQQVLAKEQGLSVGKDVAWSALEKIAYENKFHPVQEYLSSLTWDGKPRLKNWLHVYFGADDTEYNGNVGKWWLISAVARAMHPGCQVDYCLILEGEQGIGKSQGINILAGKWYLGSLPDIRDRDRAADTIADSWIIEIAELDAIKGAGMTRVKEFVSQMSDKYRPAYARATVVRQRGCVFIGTTNEKIYLNDPTGARRFWPVECKRPVDRDALTRDRDQLWAEALVALKAGEKHYPSKEHLAEIEEQQEARRDAHPWEAAIAEWVARKNKTSVTAEEVLADCFYIKPADQGRADTMVVGTCLRKLKFKPARVWDNNQKKQVRGWLLDNQTT